MALQSYSVNYEKSKEAGSDVCFLYDLKIPPHGSIREEWTTHGLQHGPAKILFVEYRMEDDDIDGVWEKHVNSFGEETKFIRYFLKKDKK